MKEKCQLECTISINIVTFWSGAVYQNNYETRPVIYPSPLLSCVIPLQCEECLQKAVLCLQVEK